jgi:hypothetical protein
MGAAKGVKERIDTGISLEPDNAGGNELPIGVATAADGRHHLRVAGQDPKPQVTSGTEADRDGTNRQLRRHIAW